MNKIGFAISSVLLTLAIGLSCLFVVDQRQFAVVYTLAEIKEVITEPGLNCRYNSGAGESLFTLGLAIALSTKSWIAYFLAAW